MNLNEAVEKLKKGYKIRRKNWIDIDYYIEVTNNGQIVDNNGLYRSIGIVSLSDLTEDAWELFKTEDDKLKYKGKKYAIYEACSNMSSCNKCKDTYKDIHKNCIESNCRINIRHLNSLSEDLIEKMYENVKNNEED